MRERSSVTFAVAVLAGLGPVASVACDSSSRAPSAVTDPTSVPGSGIVSGGGSGSPDGGGAAPSPTSTSSSEKDAGSTTPEANVDAAPPAPTKTDPAGQKPPPSAVLCAKPTASFDVGRFRPTTDAPASFLAAWRQEAQATLVPGLVVKLTGAVSGPVLAAAGSVHATGGITWALDGSPLSADALSVTQGPTDPLHIKVGPTTRGLQIAFGTATQRHGFIVTSLTLDASVDIACEQLYGRATLTIPGMNGSQPFGVGTLGDALGPLTVDVDNDGTVDSWRVSLEGSASSVLVP